MPILFVLERILIEIKLILGFIGFFYVIWMLLKIEGKKFQVNRDINWKEFWKHTLIKFIAVIVITTCYVALMEPDNLFVVMLNKPLLWIIILFVYSLFSVYPQELIFRTFFFERYKPLIKNKILFIYLNATLFSLAHLFFRNNLVILLTFFGGLFFAHTYNRTKSTLSVSIEHAIYGSWLFTVGMGEMLGFPA